MIVSGHIISAHATPFSLSNPDEIIKLFFYGGFLVAVNCFIMVSGYFGIHFKKERLIGLMIQTAFYSVILYLLSIFIGWHQFTPRTDFMYFFPILFKQYWFVTCYVVLYLIAPLLNKWAEAMSSTEFMKNLTLGFLLIYLWPTVNFLVNAPQLIDDAGYGIVNFAYLYLLGRFLRLHFNEYRPTVIYWGGYFFIVVFLFACQYVISWILGFEFTSWFSYNTVFIFAGAVSLFMAFKNLNIQSELINKFAKPCLAVYLIHKHPCVWPKICKVVSISSFHDIGFILIVFLLPIPIYLICIIVEMLRIKMLTCVEEYVVKKIVK